jgi:hypothetical protein
MFVPQEGIDPLSRSRRNKRAQRLSNRAQRRIRGTERYRYQISLSSLQVCFQCLSMPKRHREFSVATDDALVRRAESELSAYKDAGISWKSRGTCQASRSVRIRPSAPVTDIIANPAVAWRLAPSLSPFASYSATNLAIPV